jgi:hypothetical protein
VCYDKNFNVFPTHWIEGKRVLLLEIKNSFVQSKKQSTGQSQKKVTTKKENTRGDEQNDQNTHAHSAKEKAYVVSSLVIKLPQQSRERTSFRRRRRRRRRISRDDSSSRRRREERL